MIYIPEEFDPVKPDKIYTVDQLLPNLDKLQLGAKIKQGYITKYPLLYQNKPIHIYSPELSILFGINKYKHINEDKQRFSLHLSLDDKTEEKFKFRSLCESLDMFAFQRFGDTHDVYYSALRPNYKDLTKPLCLRIKIPSHQDLLLINVYHEDELLSQKIETFEKYVHHGITCKCIIQVTGIWFASNKFGVSYKLKALKIVRPKIEFK